MVLYWLRLELQFLVSHVIRHQEGLTWLEGSQTVFLICYYLNMVKGGHISGASPLM